MQTVDESETALDGPGAPPAGPRGFRAWSGRQWAALGGCLLFLAGAIGYFVAERSDSVPGGGSVDVGFLQDMMSHHEQAVQMSWLELDDGELSGVQVFAREIVYFQAYEIGLMESILREWGYRRENRSDTAMAWMDMPVPVAEMPGMASAGEMEALASSTGRGADALFVRLMQDHHRGGVHMAEHAAEHASDGYVRELAQRFARNQRIEINEMERAAERAGLPAEPAGFEPALIPGDQTGSAQHAGH